VLFHHGDTESTEERKTDAFNAKDAKDFAEYAKAFVHGEAAANDNETVRR
jgi:hypothetical protein